MDQPSLADWLNGDAPEAPPVVPSPVVGDYAQVVGLNWSTLSLMATSAKLLRHRVDNPRPDSEDLAQGRLIHTATLEPKRWADVVPLPDFGDGRTKAAKEAKAAWLAENAGRTTIDADDHALAEQCARAVRAHGAAGPLLRNGRVEETIVWERDGVKCKARLDFVAPTYLVDLKSTKHGELRGMMRDAASYLFHGQVAWYLDGAIAARVLPPDARAYIVAVQKSEPHDVAVMEVGIDALDRGRALCRRLFDRYVACQAADWWPGIAPEVITLQLPPWAAGGDEEGDSW